MRIRTKWLAVCLLAAASALMYGCSCPIRLGEAHVTWRVNSDGTADMLIELAPAVGGRLISSALEELAAGLDEGGQVVTVSRSQRPTGQFETLTLHFPSISSLETTMMAPGLLQSIPFENLGIDLPDELQIDALVPFRQFEIQRDSSPALSTVYSLNAQSSAEMASAYASCFDAWFHVELPGIVTASNATSRDKGALTWQIQPGQPLEIEVTSRAVLGEVGPYVLGGVGIIVGVIVLVGAGIGVGALVRQRRTSQPTHISYQISDSYNLDDEYSDEAFGPSPYGTASPDEPDFQLGDGYPDDPPVSEDWGTEVSSDDY